MPPGFAPQTVSNTATGSASTPDPTPADNGMTAGVVVLPTLPVPAATREVLLLLALAVLALGGAGGGRHPR